MLFIVNMHGISKNLGQKHKWTNIKNPQEKLNWKLYNGNFLLWKLLWKVKTDNNNWMIQINNQN